MNAGFARVRTLRRTEASLLTIICIVTALLLFLALGGCAAGPLHNMQATGLLD
jgi:hypothetical protein